MATHTISGRVLNNIFAKSKGLIGSKKAYPILFSTRFGIHTFSMKCSIDVIILDTNMKVIKIRENLPPNKFFFWNPVFNRVVELPKGLIQSKKIRIGDHILFMDKIYFLNQF